MTLFLISQRNPCNQARLKLVRLTLIRPPLCLREFQIVTQTRILKCKTFTLWGCDLWNRETVSEPKAKLKISGLKFRIPHISFRRLDKDYKREKDKEVQVGGIQRRGHHFRMLPKEKLQWKANKNFWKCDDQKLSQLCIHLFWREARFSRCFLSLIKISANK